MAIFTPSQLVTDLRGSAGAETFSRNGSRAYVKERKAPTDTPSGYKSAARFAFGYSSQLWAALTETQRQSWNKAALKFHGKHRLGLAAPISGINYFVRWNMWLTLFGFSNVEEPGYPTRLPAVRTFNPICNDTNVGADLNNGFGVANGITIGYSTPPLSVGKMSVNSSQLNLVTFSGIFSGTNVFDMTTDWTNRYGTPSDFIPGKCFFGIRFVDLDSGSFSPMYNKSVIIT